MVDLSSFNRRHWSEALYLQLMIRYRYYTENWFGLKPLISPTGGYVSPFRPKECPMHDNVTVWGFNFLYFVVGMSREYVIPYGIFCLTGITFLLNKLHDYLIARIMKQYKDAGYSKANRDVPIPEYDWKNGSPEQFYESFVKRPHPVILRGFMKDTSLLKELSWKTILQRFGEEDVYLTKKELDGYLGKLKEVDSPNVYLHNSELLFNKYPDIKTHFQYERLEPYLKMKVGYEQIFAGRAGTGSPFHSAAVYNMFYMIDGKKKWWFVDPYDSILAYPTIMWGKAANVLCCLWPTEYNKDAFPLFEFCPVYSAVLEAGDVLFNPPWWWHSIKNVTDVSTAVATRWHTDGICGHNHVSTEEDYNINRMQSFFFFMGFRSWPFLHSILQTPSPRFDEHVTIREKNNRYVHNQIIVAERGGVSIMGTVTKF